MDITGLWRKVPVRDDTDWLMLPYGARGLYLNDFWGGDGQRLRPCPGCLRCRSCVGCEVLTFEGDTCEDSAPVRPAPEWRHTVEPGNDPDPQVDPSYQRSTQRACQRNYPKTEKRRR